MGCRTYQSPTVGSGRLDHISRSSTVDSSGLCRISKTGTGAMVDCVIQVRLVVG